MAQENAIGAGGATSVAPTLNRIKLGDVTTALREGLADYREKPSHYVMAVVIYPVIGLLLVSLSSWRDMLHLAYPLLTGFALLGPLAAIGLYEISRRREKGMDTSWRHAFSVVRSPGISAIAGVGLLLLVLFVAWMLAAQAIFVWLFGGTPPDTLTGLIDDVLTTSRGMTLIVVGNLVGLVFAIAVLCVSVISFPLILDRHVDAGTAIRASMRSVMENPVPMLAWGLIVAVSLLVGTALLLVGLIVVLPILGHSTWHLYRKVVPASG